MILSSEELNLVTGGDFASCFKFRNCFYKSPINKTRTNMGYPVTQLVTLKFKNRRWRVIPVK